MPSGAGLARPSASEGLAITPTPEIGRGPEGRRLKPGDRDLLLVDGAGVTRMRIALSRVGEPVSRFLGDRRRAAVSSVLVLSLPACFGDYLRGRRRQALRTNIRRAQALGLACRPVTPQAARAIARSSIEAASAILHLDKYQAEHHAEGMEDWIGVDGHGCALAFARVHVSGDLAMIMIMVAVRTDKRSVIRYKLVHDVLEDLSRRAIRFVIVYSEGEASAGDRYFAKLLGFEELFIRKGAIARFRRSVARRLALLRTRIAAAVRA